MICPACGSENPDGSVFCNTCGERIVVGIPDGIGQERPFFAYQWMGSTHLLSFYGWAVRYLVMQVFVLAMIAVMTLNVVGYGTAGSLAFLITVAGGAVYFLLWYLLIRRYRARGTPMDFGGGGPPV